MTAAKSALRFLSRDAVVVLHRESLSEHGCIRLPLAFAKALFGVTRLDQEVFVLQDTATPVKRPEPKPVVDPVLAPTMPPVETTSTQEAPVLKAIDNYPPAPSA